MSGPSRTYLRMALQCLFLAILASSSAADDPVVNIVAELKQRTKFDVPTLAEYDILCRYRNETWTIHSVSFMGRQSRAPGNAMKGEAPGRMNVLFPTNTFMAVGSCLDPLSLGLMLDHASPRLLPSEKLDGLECKVLQLDSLPEAQHIGAYYPLPDLQNATVRLYVHEGRILRVVAEIRCKPAARGLGPPLIAEFSPRYRRPRTGAQRTAVVDPIARFDLPDNRGAGVTDIAWSPDGKSIACQSFNNGLKLFSVDNAREIRTIPSSDWISQIRFTPDSRYLVTHNQQDGFLHYSDVETGQEVKSVSMRGASYLTLSPNGTRALVWANAPRLRLVDCPTGRILCDLSTTNTRDAQFNADGSQLAVLVGNQITIKDTATGRDLHSFRSKCEQYGQPGRAGSWRMAFSTDSRLLAIGVGSTGNTLYNLLDEQHYEPVFVYVYEIETGQLVKTLAGLNGSVSVLRFSPSGNMLAVGEADDRGEVVGDNAAVMLWETKTWRSLGATAVQPQSAILRMEFSPDGKRFSTVAEHSPSVEVWLLPRP